jgi:hypothetical protein
MAGLGFLTLAKAKNILRGYSSPKTFELAETDRCVAYDWNITHVCGSSAQSASYAIR